MVKKLVLTIFFTALLLSGLGLTGSAYCTSESSSNSLASDVSSTVWSITWNHTYAGSNLLEVDSIIQTADGGYLLGGTTSTSPGTVTKIEVVKVDSSGNLQWNKTYEGIGNHYSKWLIQTSDGEYALAGEYLSAGQNEIGFWLAKIDTDGNIRWTKTYIGEGFSWAVSLTQTSDGGYALTGPTNVTSTSPAGDMDIWLVKTDSLGNQQWSKTLGDGMVNSVIQTSDGGYALTGYMYIDNSPDYLLIKTSSTGDMQWTKTYGSEDKDVAYTVVQTSDEGYALGGWMWLRSNGGGANFAIVKTDASGNEQWTQYYGEAFARCMIQTKDGGFALGGNKLVKVDSAGNEQWKVSFGENNTTNYEAYSVIQTQDGGYAIAGASYPTTGNPITYAWLAKIDSTSPIQSPTPTASIPESPSWIVIALLVATTASLLATRKKIRNF